MLQESRLPQQQEAFTKNESYLQQIIRENPKIYLLGKTLGETGADPIETCTFEKGGCQRDAWMEGWLDGAGVDETALQQGTQDFNNGKSSSPRPYDTETQPAKSLSWYRGWDSARTQKQSDI